MTTPPSAHIIPRWIAHQHNDSQFRRLELINPCLFNIISYVPCSARSTIYDYLIRRVVIVRYSSNHSIVIVGFTTSQHKAKHQLFPLGMLNFLSTPPHASCTHPSIRSATSPTGIQTPQRPLSPMKSGGMRQTLIDDFALIPTILEKIKD